MIPSDNEADAVELLSTKSAARFLGVTGPTIRGYANSGKLPADRLPGGQLRFTKENLMALLGPNSQKGSIDE